MFYVYTYNNPVTGYPVYIGKGRGDRYKQHLRKSSNESLREFLSEQEDYQTSNVQIVFESDDENLVLSVEEFLISQYGLSKDGGLLFNKLKSGGSNVTVELDDSVIELLGKYPDRVVEEITGVNWSTLRDRRRELGIKSFKEVNKGTTKYSKLFLKDFDIITLYDTNGRSFSGTRVDLCQRLGLNNTELGVVLKGGRNHTKGYFSTPSDKVTPYTEFKFERSNQTFTGTYNEFAETFNLLPRSVRNICTGHRKDLKGWLAERVIYE